MLDCRLIDKGEEAEVLLIGRLDSNSSIDAEEVLLSLTTRFSKLVFNLEELKYISSAGLRIFNKLCKVMNKTAGELVVINVSPQVMEIFELTGYANILNIR